MASPRAVGASKGRVRLAMVFGDGLLEAAEATVVLRGVSSLQCWFRDCECMLEDSFLVCTGWRKGVTVIDGLWR